MLKHLTIKIPETYLQEVEELVEKGFYISKTEALRIALRDFIWKYSK
jgi:Arc/MetJ-type ribon-helix-helix transcriptional regulator